MKSFNEELFTESVSLPHSLFSETQFFPLRNDFKNYEFCVFHIHLLEIYLDLPHSFLRKTKTENIVLLIEPWSFLAFT